MRNEGSIMYAVHKQPKTTGVIVLIPHNKQEIM